MKGFRDFQNRQQANGEGTWSFCHFLVVTDGECSGSVVECLTLGSSDGWFKSHPRHLVLCP